MGRRGGRARRGENGEEPKQRGGARAERQQSGRGRAHVHGGVDKLLMGVAR